MGLRNCPECKRLFTGGSHDICPDCVRKEEEDYDKVSVYLKRNPKSSIEDVEKNTEVQKKKIVKFLKAGKILATDIETGEPLLTCAACKMPIESGKYCQKCAEELSSRLKGKQQKLPGQEPKKQMPGDKGSGHMHTMERIMKKREGR